MPWLGNPAMASRCNFVGELVNDARHAGSVTYDLGARLVCRSCGYQPQNFGFMTTSSVGELVNDARHAGSVTYDSGARLICRSCGYQPQNFGFMTSSVSQLVHKPRTHPETISSLIISDPNSVSATVTPSLCSDSALRTLTCPLST